MVDRWYFWYRQEVHLFKALVWVEVLQFWIATFSLEKQTTSLCCTVESIFAYLEPLGSRVWQTDGQTYDRKCTAARSLLRWVEGRCRWNVPSQFSLDQTSDILLTGCSSAVWEIRDRVSKKITWKRWQLRCIATWDRCVASGARLVLRGLWCTSLHQIQRDQPMHRLSY